MEDYLGQMCDMLVGRETGPLAFRFIIQPLVATMLGVRAGLKDARETPRLLLDCGDAFR